MKLTGSHYAAVVTASADFMADFARGGRVGHNASGDNAHNMDYPPTRWP